MSIVGDDYVLPDRLEEHHTGWSAKERLLWLTTSARNAIESVSVSLTTD